MAIAGTLAAGAGAFKITRSLDRKAQLSALLTAGFVLFVITLGVNTVAAMVIKRSRSGAGTEL